MSFYRTIFGYLIFLVLALFILFYPYIFPGKQVEKPENSINVLTYSSFVKPWGPGPELAKMFFEDHGINVSWIDAGNAGLILERLRFKNQIDQPDVVLGFDQFSIIEARKLMDWRDLHDAYAVEKPVLPEGSTFRDFLAFDWGPLTFIYRKGEIEPPRHLLDLLKPEYHKKLILQDPRMSSPGLQFLFWSLMVFGEQEGFSYLSRLKNSIQILAPSWSSSYSLFQVKNKSLVFSYFTSPLYHLNEEGRDDYEAVVFEHAHPVQVEYAGVPSICNKCSEGELFVRFLASAKAQRVIFHKNYMYPMNGAAIDESESPLPKNIKYFSPIESWSMIRDKKEIVERWKRVFY